MRVNKIDQRIKSVSTTLLFLAFLFFTKNINGQAVDISSTSEGIVVSRMTETQRNNIATTMKGLLIYQTDEKEGFYFYNGDAWIKVTDTGDLDPIVKINGDNIADMGLGYSGPSYSTDESANGFQFVTKQGYFINILATDRIARVYQYFTNSTCSGVGYSRVRKTGRGIVFRDDAGLLYIPKNAPIIAELEYNSILTGVAGQPYNCNVINNTTDNLFQIIINDSNLTGITLDPALDYLVSFGN